EAAQPDYGLRHKINVAGLDRIVYSADKVSQREVLDYYSNIAAQILPYLKDRYVSLRFQGASRRKDEYTTLTQLVNDDLEDIPDWVKTKGDAQWLVCPDKEHLLFFASIGCVEFGISSSTVKNEGRPDLLLIGLDRMDADAGKALKVAAAFREVLSGLEVASFVKT